MTTEDWPFADAQNVAVFTTRQVVRGRRPITFVGHDEDDGAWQFHCHEASGEADAMVVSLKEMTRLDKTVKELADLPLGWCATRESPADDWQRQPKR